MNGHLAYLKDALQKTALPQTLQSPLDQLFQLLEAVLEENKLLKEQNLQLVQRVHLLEEEVARYRQELFGRQSEKSSALTLATSDVADTAVKGEEVAGSQTVSAYVRKPRVKGRTVDISRLLHTEILHDLSPEERQCAQCQSE